MQNKEEWEGRFDKTIGQEIILDQEVRAVIPGIKSFISQEKEKSYQKGVQDGKDDISWINNEAEQMAYQKGREEDLKQYRIKLLVQDGYDKGKRDAIAMFLELKKDETTPQTLEQIIDRIKLNTRLQTLEEVEKVIIEINTITNHSRLSRESNKEISADDFKDEILQTLNKMKEK